MIIKQVRRIGVDAGIIMICDQDYYTKKNGQIDKKLSRVIDIPIGIYNLKWSIPETWNGQVSGEGLLEVTSGKVVISDPCYIIRDINWNQWLDETDYGNRPPLGTLILDKMGGDGNYTVNLELLER